VHPIETGVCCEHTSPTGECGRWKCRHPHVGLLSDRGAPGGKKDGVRPEDEVIKGQKEKGEEVKGEEAMDENAGGVAASSASPATTTSLCSSLSSFSSSSSPSSPHSCHYQSSSAAGQHTDGAIGATLQVHSTSSFSPPSPLSLL